MRETQPSKIDIFITIYNIFFYENGDLKGLNTGETQPSKIDICITIYNIFCDENVDLKGLGFTPTQGRIYRGGMGWHGPPQKSLCHPRCHPRLPVSISILCKPLNY